MSRPILCLDFDGVCHSYKSGWQGASVIPDPPVEGIFDFLNQAKEHFEIHIYSTRSNYPEGITAMQVWFGKHFTDYMFKKNPSLKEKFDHFLCPPWLNFPKKKPPAYVTIDDRAINFDGKWPDIDLLKNFQPWYKSKERG